MTTTESYTGQMKNQGETGAIVELPDDEEDAQLGEVLGHLASAMAKWQEELQSKEEADRSKEVYRVERDPKTYEVRVKSDITLDDYRNITTPEIWAMLESAVADLKGKRVVFINPTYEGGGVAMLRPPLVHLLTMLGVNAHWFVMEKNKADEPNPFVHTKLIHNISQRQAGDERITQEGKDVIQDWCDKNNEVLTKQPEILYADIILLDDPQTAGLLKGLRAATRKARSRNRGLGRRTPMTKFAWRNHIDTSHDLMADPATPQGEVSNFVMEECDVGSVDAIVAHPEAKFIHPGMEDKTYFAPATIDPFDDLNKELDAEQIQQGIDFINNEIRLKNLELGPEDQQQAIDVTRNRICLVARFDESKGMDIAMDLGVRIRQRLRSMGVPEEKLPQVVIIGNGSVDDPSGEPMYENMLALRREKPPEEREGIVLMRLKHNYQAMNALMYRQPGTVLVGMQTSTAEGMETRITDWFRHRVPCVISNCGAMYQQLRGEEAGIKLNYDKPDKDLDRGADYVTELMTNPEAYEAVCASVEKQYDEYNSREFTTVANVIRLARVFSRVLNRKPANLAWRLTRDDLNH